jgi:hypothetical protein
VPSAEMMDADTCREHIRRLEDGLRMLESELHPAATDSQLKRRVEELAGHFIRAIASMAELLDVLESISCDRRLH